MAFVRYPRTLSFGLKCILRMGKKASHDLSIANMVLILYMMSPRVQGLFCTNDNNGRVWEGTGFWYKNEEH